MAAGLVNFDLGRLAKPATVLVERVSDAVGGIAKPWQLRRVANAEADVKITDRQQRAARRFIEEETKNQINIECITHQTIAHLNEDSQPEKIEEDLLRNFFDKCCIVSDEQMQDIWGADATRNPVVIRMGAETGAGCSPPRIKYEAAAAAR